METTVQDAVPPRAASPGPLASFIRFVLCGGVGLASSAAVLLLALLMPWAVANALITVVSTRGSLFTELRRRSW
jgi:putative flippase GtrA